ncbi:MAG: CARDB domain-containing protein [Patescibacteria group bacterium]
MNQLRRTFFSCRTLSSLALLTAVVIGGIIFGHAMLSHAGDYDNPYECEGSYGPASCSGGGSGNSGSGTITATPSTIYYGDEAQLSWSTSYVTGCSVDPTIGYVTPNVTESQNVAPTVSTSYMLTCDMNGGGSFGEYANVTVVPNPTATGSISADVNPCVLSGGSCSPTVSWDTVNASAAKVSVQKNGGTETFISTLTSGTYAATITPSPDYYDFRLYDYSGGTLQSLLATTRVTAFPVPTVSLTAAQTSVTSGSSTTLSWSSSNATSCTGTNFSTANATSGSVSTGALTANKTYSITCTGSGGSATASVTVAVTAATVTGSCSVSPTTASTGTAVTWTAVPSGGTGTYTYSWSGTDSLSGTTSSVSKTYTTSGAKTASVTITSGASSATIPCSNSVTTSYPAVDVSCSVSPTSVYTGNPVTWTAVPSGGTGTYTYSWSGTDSLSGSGPTVSKTYTTSGIKTASVTITSGVSSKTVSCSNSAAASVSVADLVPSSLSPLTVTAGVSTTFTAGVTNTGTNATPTFGSTMYVCLTSDTTCINNYLTRSNSFWDRVFAFLFSFAEANTSIKVALSRITLSAGASGSETGSYTFTSTGPYQVRFCADTPLNEVPEPNEGDNCTSWTGITVNPGTLAASCSASPSSGYIGDTYTWTAAASGGTGTYTYSWSGTDSLSGSGATVSKTYSTSGTKSGSVLVTSGAQSLTATCTTATVKSPPTAVITATPSDIVAGVNTSRIDWTSTNAASCTSTKFATGNATSGSVTLSPTVTTAYDLTCSDGTRPASSNAVVTVSPVGLTLSVSPGTTVRQGDGATVTWSAVGTPTSCSISGPGLSSTAVSGSQGVTINQQSTYTFTCIASGVSTTKSIVISVTPHFEEF